MMRTTVSRFALACGVSAMLAGPAVAKSTGRAAAEGCITTGVAASASVWIASVLAAPFTGGASLLVPLVSDKVIIAGTIGCVAGAAGSASAEQLLPDQSRKSKR